MLLRIIVVLTLALLFAGIAPAQTRPSTQPNDAAMKTWRLLMQPVEEFSGRDEKVETLIDHLREIAKLPLGVQWDDLSAAGVKKDARITIGVAGSVVDVLEQILDLAAAQQGASDPGARPQYVVQDDGRIIVATKRTIYSRYATERRYEIADLVTSGAPDPDRKRENTKQFAAMIQNIVDVEWSQSRDELGGTVRSDGTSLVVVQTEEGHRRVGSAIARMRFIRSDDGKRAEAAAPVDDTKQRIATKNVGDVSFTGDHILVAFRHLREVTGENIFINWRALEAAQIKADLPVTVDLRDLPLDQALDRLLAEIGGTRVKLAWVIDEGVISVSTADDLARNVVTRVYDIRDAIVEGRPREPQIGELIKKVEGIDPQSWKTNGGQIGSVRELAGQLIITQTPEVHERITALLKEYAPKHERTQPDR